MPSLNASGKKNLRPERPDAADGRDVLDATSLTQHSLPWCWTSERSYHGGLRSDTAHQGTVRMDTTGMATEPGRSCRCICLLDEECHGNCPLDAAHVLRTQGVKQMASGRSLPRHHVSRCSCQGATCPAAAATAYAFRMRSVMATALGTQGVKADGIQMEPATAPRVQTQLSRQLHSDPVVTALNIAEKPSIASAIKDARGFWQF